MRWTVCTILFLRLLFVPAAAKESKENKGSVAFYLQDRDGTCLGPTGTFGSCDFKSLWIYASRPGRREGHSIVSLLEPSQDQSCFTRIKCHSSSSPLGVAKCGACGSKSWELVQDRTTSRYIITADEHKNCVVRTSKSAGVRKKLTAGSKGYTYQPSVLFNSASMQSCSSGGSSLQIVDTSVHDAGFFLMTVDHHCFDGKTFRPCSAKNADLYWGIGIRFGGSGESIRTLYKFHKPTKCLARVGKDTDLKDCDDSSAKHWGLKDGQLSIQNSYCVVRDLTHVAHLQKCSYGTFENIQIGLPQASTETAMTDPRLSTSDAYRQQAARAAMAGAGL